MSNELSSASERQPLVCTQSAPERAQGEAVLKAVNGLSDASRRLLERGAWGAYELGASLAFIHEVKRVMNDVGISHAVLARRLGLAKSNITNWLNGVQRVEAEHKAAILRMPEFRGVSRDVEHAVANAWGLGRVVCWIHKNVFGKPNPKKHVLTLPELCILHTLQRSGWAPGKDAVRVWDGGVTRPSVLERLVRANDGAVRDLAAHYGLDYLVCVWKLNLSLE